MTTTALSEALAKLRQLKVPNWPAGRILGDIADEIESALASAEPVAWQRRTDVALDGNYDDWCPISKEEYDFRLAILAGRDSCPMAGSFGCTQNPLREDKFGWFEQVRALYTHAQPAAKVETPGYKLSDEQIATLLSEGLKPEEIGGTAEVQHARVGELVRWFARLATGSANPKWARPHAFELAYFVATSAGNRHIDINKVREDGFKEGAMVSPQDRGSLERIGFLQPMPAPTPASDYPECSGDPGSCPENEGRGCCKPNPVKTPASVPDGWAPTDEQYRAWCETHDMQESVSREAFDDAASLYLLEPTP